MAQSRIRTLLGVVWFAVLLLGSANLALAVPTHASALDARVNTIDRVTLLHAPATSLVDPDRQAAADRLARWTLPGWLLSALAQVAVLAYFWRSGRAARLRDALQRRITSMWLARFVFGAALALLAKIASAIPDFYLYRIDRIMGLTHELARAWALQWSLDTLVSMLAVGLLIAVVLWLVELTHQWYIYTAIGVVAVSVAAAYLTPYVRSLAHDHTQPIRGALADRLDRMERRAGIALPIYVKSGAGLHAPSVSVEGLGNSDRVVISQALLDSGSANETAFAVAYELGYVRAHDPLKRALLDALLVILGAALAVFVADRIGFRRDDSELSRMALVGSLLCAAYLVVVPIDHAVAASMTLGADRFAVEVTHHRAPAVRSLVRQTDRDLEQVCPNILTRIFLSRAPSAGVRIAAINGVPNGCP